MGRMGYNEALKFEYAISHLQCCQLGKNKNFRYVIFLVKKPTFAVEGLI